MGEIEAQAKVKIIYEKCLNTSEKYKIYLEEIKRNEKVDTKWAFISDPTEKIKYSRLKLQKVYMIVIVVNVCQGFVQPQALHIFV